jgi:hypothetical protein
MILCAPGPPDEHSIAGSTPDICSECGREIHVAPSGRELVKTVEQPARFVCMGCGFALIEADPDPKLHEPTREQRDELARHREHNL